MNSLKQIGLTRASRVFLGAILASCFQQRCQHLARHYGFFRTKFRSLGADFRTLASDFNNGFWKENSENMLPHKFVLKKFENVLSIKSFWKMPRPFCCTIFQKSARDRKRMEQQWVSSNTSNNQPQVSWQLSYKNRKKTALCCVFGLK